MTEQSRTAVKPAGGARARPGTEKIQWVHVDKVIPYERNPRINDGAVEAVAASIKEFGWRQPIVVDRDHVIIAGHTRLLAALQLGEAKVPVLVAADLSPAQVKAYRLADNRTHQNSTWNEELLALELQDLQAADFDLGSTGFADDELRNLLGGLEEKTGDGAADEEDEIPPVQEVAVSQRGDLWILGEHRLLCGDSASAEDVSRLMQGQRATLFATDPPYLVDYKGGNHPPNRRQNNAPKDWSDRYIEHLDGEAGQNFYADFCRVAKEHAIAENAAWYCWHASRRQKLLEEVWNDLGVLVHQQIIWVKSRATLIRCVFLQKHEPCLFGWLKGKKPHIKTDYAEGEFPATVWEIPNSEVESLKHPTSKPVRIFTIPMEMHTQPGELCYEPFSGSGSQIIAAERMNRRCFGLELSPLFVDVAVRRWQNESGAKATLEDDGRSFEAIEKARMKANGAKAKDAKVA